MPANIHVKHMLPVEGPYNVAVYSNATIDGIYHSPDSAIDTDAAMATIQPWADSRTGLGEGELGEGELGESDIPRTAGGLGEGPLGEGALGYNQDFDVWDMALLTGHPFRSGVYLFQFGFQDGVENETLSDMYRLVLHATPDPPRSFAFSVDDGDGKPVFAITDSPDFVIGV